MLRVFEEEPALQKSAVQALGSIATDDRQTIQALVFRLEDVSSAVRSGVVKALGAVRRAVELQKDFFTALHDFDEEEEVETVAKQTLG